MGPSAPNAPNATLPRERFIALHMICVRISPEAPTRAPAMIRIMLPSTNPVAAAASPEYELSSETTTGMSAPPMGITSRTPRTRAAAARAKYISGVGSPAANATPAASMPRKSTALAVFCNGNTTGLPVTTPCSLPKAMKLPDRVTAPISVPRTIVAAEAAAKSPPPPATRRNSAPATAADAPPPKPLKAATSWGIAVIWIVRARTAPARAPATTDAATVGQLRISFWSTVTSTATSMARAARAFPERAVAGDESCLIPETKRNADASSAK